MKLDDFHFNLPEELIAQEPLAERESSRLLVLHRTDGSLEHRLFSNLPEYLRPGDLLVVNDAKVIPARLLGKKTESGGKVELLLTMPLSAPSGSTWRCLGQASKAIRKGALLDFDGLRAEVLANHSDGSYDVRFFSEHLADELERVGRVPLPPYIRRQPNSSDRQRYQTVFAANPGAAAAPTAGFHFTQSLLERVQSMGVEVAKVTLYVGAGTFLPVRADEIEQHRMHPERYEVSRETAEAFARARERGGRIVAVGTTSARTIETAWEDKGLREGSGISELFIYPGYRFRGVDALVTNFHLPKSTLLMLVSAIAGRERILAAYREAIALGYRFFSYGDAMIIV